MASLKQLQTDYNRTKLSEMRFLNLYFWINWENSEIRKISKIHCLYYVENGAVLEYFLK